MLDNRRKRNKLPDDVIKQLEKVFRQQNGAPDSDLISELSEKHDVHRDKIRIWFNNRRAKLRRLALEKELVKVKDTSIPDHLLLTTIYTNSGGSFTLSDPPLEPTEDEMQAVKTRISELQEFVKTILPDDDLESE